MLKINNLHVHYGGIKALKGISVEVPEKKIISLIGANGAGKSTTLRCVIGLVPSASGSVIYNGENITKMKTMNIVKKGMVLIPEGRRVFPNLTTDENLILGAYAQKNKKEVEKDKKNVFDIFSRLYERRTQKAGTLSGGEQQMLSVGRALMSKPKLLMMDEPSLGLAPLLVKEVFKIIKDINDLGVTILLIEQNAKAALEIADYGYVLETGRIVLEGNGKELLINEDVKKSYLGIS